MKITIHALTALLIGLAASYNIHAATLWTNDTSFNTEQPQRFQPQPVPQPLNCTTNCVGNICTTQCF